MSHRNLVKQYCVKNKMYYSTRVLSLLVLQMGLVNSFPWDIVVGKQKGLEFFKNGTLTHTEEISSANKIESITYDPVHYRVLFYDEGTTASGASISSFDLLTRKIELLVKLSFGYLFRLAYDPVTESLFWNEDSAIYSFSLHPACSKKENDGTKLLSFHFRCSDLAVDSCGGHIYWITPINIERARLDGSKREVLIDDTVYDRQSLAIDQQTQKIYWFENIYKNGVSQVSIKSADFNGKDRITLYNLNNNQESYGSLAVSQDFIYWSGTDLKAIWQLPKNPQKNVEAKLLSNFDRSDNFYYKIIAANYTIEAQTQGHQNCESLKSLIPETPDVYLFCVNGTKVSGESRCECAQGYTGERCDISVCHNYCLQGDCSVSAEGQPKCRCTAGYSGDRCEVNACYKQCLHNGACTLNEEDEPVCECTGDYEGERCDIATTQTSVHSDKTIKELLRNLRVFSFKHDEYEIKV